MLAPADGASVRDLTLPFVHPLAVEQGRFGVWSVYLDAVARDGDELTTQLSPDERARAARYADQAKGRRFAIGRAVVRAILGELIDVEPALVGFSYNRDGKPFLARGAADLGLQFNVSHVRDLLVVAVAGGRRVGVDVAQRSGSIPLDKIVARFFSLRERSAFAAVVDDRERRATFARIWVRKEAYLKGRGEGISERIYATDFRDPDARAAELSGPSAPLDQDGWEIRDLVGLPEGIVGSVALERC